MLSQIGDLGFVRCMVTRRRCPSANCDEWMNGYGYSCLTGSMDGFTLNRCFSRKLDCPFLIMESRYVFPRAFLLPLMVSSSSRLALNEL
ncbi:unnamed protein product [Cochlearia groenlandica]